MKKILILSFVLVTCHSIVAFGESHPPRKAMSIGVVGMSSHLNSTDGGYYVDSTHRLSLGFSLQTSIYPIMGDICYTLNNTLDFGLGAYLPVRSLGKYELTISPFAFFRNRRTAIRNTADPDIPLNNVEETGGLALRTEILNRAGTAGLFFDVRQTVFPPFETSFGIGLSWSPLMILEWRRY